MTIGPTGHANTISPAEATLNWQSENDVAQNKVLVKILSQQSVSFDPQSLPRSYTNTTSPSLNIWASEQRNLKPSTRKESTFLQESQSIADVVASAKTPDVLPIQKDCEEFDNVKSFEHLFIAKTENAESTVQFDAEDYDEHQETQTKRLLQNSQSLNWHYYTIDVVIKEILTRSPRTSQRLIWHPYHHVSRDTHSLDADRARDYGGVIVFTSRAWRRLFDIRGPLVRELILEFLSTLRFGEVLLDLDAPVIMESLVKKKQKGAIRELKRRHLKNTIFCTYTPYPAMKIRYISASSAQETRNDQFLIRRNCLTNGTQTTPCTTNPNHAKAKTNGDTKIEISTELIMMVRNNAFNGAETNDAADHITRFLQIINIVKTPNVNIEQLCVLTFPYSLTGKAHRWWVHEGISKITSWVEIVDKFFYKYYPLSCASKSNDANGYDNTTLFDDGESSDDDCDKSNLINHHDTSPFLDPYQAAKNEDLAVNEIDFNV
ncbi:hypothetical protein Tco_1294945 [Tanacetum coccineum]